MLKRRIDMYSQKDNDSYQYSYLAEFLLNDSLESFYKNLEKILFKDNSIMKNGHSKGKNEEEASL